MVFSSTAMVTLAFILAEPNWFHTSHHWPSVMPSRAAVFGLISTNGSGHSSRQYGTWRFSEWKKAYSRAPVVSTKGYSFASSGVLTGLKSGSW